MILVFPQATNNFNNLYKEMIEKSYINDFLDVSLGSYDLNSIEKIVFILLENDAVEKHLISYLNDSSEIDSFEIVKLKKETSGSICTTLMAISTLKERGTRGGAGCQNKLYISSLSPLLISSISLNPLVHNKPTFEPFLSRRAFNPTVVP